MRRGDPRSARGLTLVELLVVMTIIGILVALLLPAVQSAREAARRVECANHLKQLGLAMLAHHQAHGRFPSGGWGWAFVGEPDRGTDKNQPGGWAFNLLEYIEQGNLRKMGNGLSGSVRTEAIIERIATPIATFNCPSRRQARTYPDRRVNHPYRTTTDNAIFATKAGLADYAINAGDHSDLKTTSGPSSVAAGDAMSESDWSKWSNMADRNGIAHQRSEVTMAQIRDGASNTYMIGEKCVSPDSYTTGQGSGDNENLYVGYDDDLFRSTHPSLGSPRQDQPGAYSSYVFGSAHPSGWQAVFCDGLVHSMSYSLDPSVHSRLGNRKDGEVVGEF